MKKIKSSTPVRSVWDDLEDNSVERENLKIRSALMMAIDCYIKENNLTQTQAAEIFEVTQPRISDLLKAKISLFSIDSLINMATRAGIHVHVVIDDRLAA